MVSVVSTTMVSMVPMSLYGFYDSPTTLYGLYDLYGPYDSLCVSIVSMVPYGAPLPIASFRPPQADSGGPLSCLSGGRWVQAGVLSFAVGCGRASGPVLATALAEHAGWLRRHLAPYGAFVSAPTAPPPGLEDGKCAGERPRRERRSPLVVT